jgi:uncharacterized protein
MSDAILLAFLIFMVAVLYSSVGQAGGTGYLAVMGLIGIAPETMRPAALALNVIVASIATFRFYQAGRVSPRLIWPFLIVSVPLAYIGGSIHLSEAVYGPIVGVVLLVAAARLFIPVRRFADLPQGTDSSVPAGRAMVSGGAIGFLSGLTGTGGGIFLSPLLTFSGWTALSSIAGMSAVFNLVNSAAALAGNLLNVGQLPAVFPLWAVAAVGGGLVGAGWGSRRPGTITTQRLLAMILMIAGIRLLFFL